MKIIGVLLILLSISLFINLYQKSVISDLKADLMINTVNTETLKDSLYKQNLYIEEMKASTIKSRDFKLNHIEKPTRACESQLKTYKQLFQELAK